MVSIIGCTGDWFGGWDGLTAGLGRSVHHGRPEARPAAGSDRPRRAGDHGLPLAGDVFQRPGDGLQDLPGRSSSACTRLTTISIWMKLEPDRPILGRSRAHPDRAPPGTEVAFRLHSPARSSRSRSHRPATTAARPNRVRLSAAKNQTMLAPAGSMLQLKVGDIRPRARQAGGMLRSAQGRFAAGAWAE